MKKTSIEPFTTYLYFFSKSQSPMSRVETKSCLISYPILAYIIGFVPSIEPDIIHASTQVCPGLYRILRQCLYRHGLYNLCTMCMHKTSNKKLTNISFEIKFIHAWLIYLTDLRHRAGVHASLKSWGHDSESFQQELGICNYQVYFIKISCQILILSTFSLIC